MLCGTGGNFVMSENVKKCIVELFSEVTLYQKGSKLSQVWGMYRHHGSQWEDLGDDTPTFKGMHSKICLWKLKYPCEFSQLSWHYHTAWHSVWPLIRLVSFPSCQFGWLYVHMCGVYNKLYHFRCMQELSMLITLRRNWSQVTSKPYPVNTPLTEINHPHVLQFLLTS